jgi:hypothetical protein
LPDPTGWTVRRSPHTVPLSPEEGLSVFSRAQQGLLRGALDEAEEHTSGYYCIPPRGWERLRYDLITRKDHEWEPLPENALARLQRVEQLSARRREKVDFFRIQLNDPTILSAARREKLDNDLYPLLVYILTHEMVHMVRLGTILDASVLPRPAEAEKEEERVDRISRKILVRARRDFFNPVLERFRNPCLSTISRETPSLDGAAGPR